MDEEMIEEAQKTPFYRDLPKTGEHRNRFAVQKAWFAVFHRQTFHDHLNHEDIQAYTDWLAKQLKKNNNISRTFALFDIALSMEFKDLKRRRSLSEVCFHYMRKDDLEWPILVQTLRLISAVNATGLQGTISSEDDQEEMLNMILDKGVNEDHDEK